MAEAKLVEVRYEWAIAVKCPRCGKVNKESWTSREKKIGEVRDIQCSCGLVFQEQVYYKYGGI